MTKNVEEDVTVGDQKGWKSMGGKEKERKR